MTTQPKQQKPYTILTIDQLTRVGDVGTERYYRVRFKTKGGVTDYVDFGEKDYTEEKISKTLTALAEKHDRILAL